MAEENKKDRQDKQASAYHWRTVLFGSAVIIWALAWPGINVYHHLELPSIDKYKYTISQSYTWTGSKTTDIRLSGEIEEPQYYESIAQILEQAKKGDTITFHLAGPGGRVDGFSYLVNNIKNTKAYVIMSVEAPVYSADAYLAIMGDELQMSKYTYLMFHFSSVLNEDCTTETGTDRGVSNQEHCQAMKDTEIKAFMRILEDSPYLTAEQKTKITLGHDVYLFPEEVAHQSKDISINKK